MRDGIDMEDDIERSFGQMKKGIAGSGCVGLYESVSVGFQVVVMNVKNELDSNVDFLFDVVWLMNTRYKGKVNVLKSASVNCFKIN